jgi:hypothetical protein
MRFEEKFPINILEKYKKGLRKESRRKITGKWNKKYNMCKSGSNNGKEGKVHRDFLTFGG